MGHTLHIDFETRSMVDLRKSGIGVYASHLSTEVLCIAYSVDDQEPLLWTRDFDQSLIPLQKAVRSAEKIYAHNAAFELAIWNNNFSKRYKLDPLPLEKVHCTMAMCYSMALPGSLEGAALALSVPLQKDMAGSRMMKQLAKPREILPSGEAIWWDDPKKYQILYEYCRQDVRVERELTHRLLQLSENERRLWLLDQKINNRGILVDLKAVKAAEEIVEYEANRLDKQIKKVTQNFVACCTETKRITEWLKEIKGLEVEGIAKANVIEMLSRKDLPADVKEVLELRQQAAKTSTAKLSGFISNAEEDGRVRNLFQYHGAATGRWAGRRIQPHNFPRPQLSQDSIESIIKLLSGQGSIEEKIQTLDMFYGNPLDAISNCLRSFIMAGPSKQLVGGDFNAIEARALAWLSGEEKVVQLFRDDLDVYKYNAIGIFKKKLESITDDERFVGKVAELALGYGGGKGAFKLMASGYGLDIDDDRAEEIKIAWRENRPMTVRYWKELELSAISAVLNPGDKLSAGPKNKAVKFLKSGSFLFCQLPSQRVLCYPFPKIEEIDTPWGEKKDGLTYMSMNSFSHKWERTKTYGGKLSENVTQAVARDLLADAMLRLEHNGFPIVMHVHDEVVAEVDMKLDNCHTTMESILSKTPTWASGLPIKAKCWRGQRYKK